VGASSMSEATGKPKEMSQATTPTKTSGGYQFRYQFVAWGESRHQNKRIAIINKKLKKTSA